MNYRDKESAKFQAPDKDLSFKASITQQTIWISLDQIPQLIRKEKLAISRHITTIFKGHKLNENPVVAENVVTAPNKKI